MSLKNSAAGFDDIDATLLKFIIPCIAQPLCYVCNLSLSEGIFPAQLKIANVLPLYTADDSMIFNNYRPVSILCALSKVFEKVMYNRLLHFINELDILYKFQFGFRKDCSTHMALITLMDKLITALENGEFTIGVFLDFSKAFNTINHQISPAEIHKSVFWGIYNVLLLIMLHHGVSVQKPLGDKFSPLGEFFYSQFCIFSVA